MFDLLLIKTIPMKILIPLFTLFTFFSLNAQNDSNDSKSTTSLNIENFSNIYVLDSGYQLRLPYTWYTADMRVSFLMLNKGDVLLTSSMRRVGKMKNHQFFGEMDGLEVSTNKEGQKVISFYARAREFRIGKVRSFEITILPDDKFLIQYYDKLGSEQFFFYARFPTKEEEKEIQELFESF